MRDKKLALALLEEEIYTCKKCRLCETPGLHVPGEGNPDAAIIFVGEGPGATEAETGRPFVGRAGKLLDNMIASMGLQRNEVYIANICKCRPPGNRKPKPDEMNMCKPYLFWQIAVIQPKVIVALGNTALGGLTGRDGGISSRCGEWETVEKLKMMPCYHPSALLRNPNWKTPAWYALQKVAKELAI